MSDEPDNSTLRLLRDIRATLDDHTTRLEHLQADLAAVREEMAATRSVLVDVVVQLTTRITRLEKA